jgi:hypothetical protein
LNTKIVLNKTNGQTSYKKKSMVAYNLEWREYITNGGAKKKESISRGVQVEQHASSCSS